MLSVQTIIMRILLITCLNVELDYCLTYLDAAQLPLCLERTVCEVKLTDRKEDVKLFLVPTWS